MVSSDFKFECITVKVDRDHFMINAVVVDGKRWLKAKQVASILGYKNTEQAVRCNVHIRNKKPLGDLCSSSVEDWNDKRTMYINDTGLIELIVRPSKPNTMEFAKQFGISTDIGRIRKETEVVAFIQQYSTCLNIPFEFQKTVGCYRVDLYIPNENIAIEIDENNHNDRCPVYERLRESSIQNHLRCLFLRFNPDAHDFNIATCLAQITKLVYNA